MQNQNYCRSVASGSTSPLTRTPQQPGKNGRVRQQNYRKAHSVSPQQSCFASSQFCNSPSARSIPLPPSHWIEKMSSNTPSSSVSSPPSSPTSSGTSSPSSIGGYNENVMGIRVCPLQLIAAVSSS